MKILKALIWPSLCIFAIAYKIFNPLSISWLKLALLLFPPILVALCIGVGYFIYYAFIKKPQIQNPNHFKDYERPTSR